MKGNRVQKSQDLVELEKFIVSGFKIVVKETDKYFEEQKPINNSKLSK